MKLTREMLPQDVLDHLPDEVEDTQIPFWWAAFERGRGAMKGATKLQPSPTPAIPAPDISLMKPLDLGSNYGDPEPEEERGVVDDLVPYAKGWHPTLNDELFINVCKTHPELQGWLRRGKLPGQRIMEGIIHDLVVKTKGILLDDS